MWNALGELAGYLAIEGTVSRRHTPIRRSAASAESLLTEDRRLPPGCVQESEGDRSMNRLFVARTLFAAVLGWSACAGLACAIGPEFPRTPPGATELPPGHPGVDNSPVKHPLLEFVRRGRPLCCWASFNGYGCSSGKSELAFIFGSCRTFFGEPCLKGAPPSALPPWAGQESGYYSPRPGAAVPGGSAPGRSGCGCP
jgi:hypothetical protein